MVAKTVRRRSWTRVWCRAAARSLGLARGDLNGLLRRGKISLTTGRSVPWAVRRDGLVRG